MEEQIRILCVDDERNVLRALERLLLDEPYEILTAPSGDEGLEVLRNSESIQVVISDYRMPGMTGVEFLRAVCADWPDTVRIVLSGYADSGAIVSAINEGEIYKFVPKPWNDDELKVTISNAVDRYLLHKKNEELTCALRRSNEELKTLNENLERIVEERTAEVIFRNKVLTRAQNILDALPVGVIGISTDGMIVLCNQRGIELLSGDGGIAGLDREMVLPAEVNALVDETVGKGSASGILKVHNRPIWAKGSFMHHPEGQEGIVIVCAEEE